MSVRGVLILANLIVGILVFLVAASLGAFRVEQAEAVGKCSLLSLLFGNHRCRHERCTPTLGQCNVALIIKEPDLATLVLASRHHASASKCGVADRVRVNVGVRSVELDVYDDQVRDVLHVDTDALLSQALRDSVADQDVASNAASDFVIDVSVDTELVLGPVDFDL